MQLKILIIIIMLILFLFPLSLLMGSFIDYTEPSNRRMLYYHPGYYYYHWYPSRNIFLGPNVDFRGGGPAFGK